MANVVTDPKEVSLNSVRYPVLRPVQPILASVYPGKVVTGDTSRDSNPNASVLAMSSWRGGIGINLEADVLPPERAWWSTCSLRYRNHLVLPSLATITAAGPTSNIGAIGELGSAIYAAFGTDVRKYNNTTNSWGASVATLAAAATDAITFRLGNVVYLAFAHTDGYTYTTDGVTWTSDTRDALYLTYWNDQLWGIDNTGLLWGSSAIGNEVDDAQLQMPDGYVTALITARNAAGDQIIYAATKVGLYAHDADGARFIETELSLPLHPFGGRGSAKWRDSIYYPAGLGMYRYINGSNQAIITSMGPDKDDGLPSDKRGTIRQVIPTLNELLIVIDGTIADSALAAINLYDGSAMGSHQAAVIAIGQSYSSILGWNDQGWETKWLSGSITQAITFAKVSDAYSKYRLWWAINQRVHWMTIPDDVVNPSQVSTFAYGATGEHITPWLNMGQIDVNKLALRLKVDAHNMTSTETAVVDYATDLSATWTNLGTITADGLTTYTFPTSANPIGTAFRWISFRITLARGATNTLTPHIHTMSLEYRKKLASKWGHQVSIDLSKDYKGNTPLQMRAALKTALDSTTLLEFAFMDDATGAHTFYVDVTQSTGLAFSGHDARGSVSLSLVER